MIQSDTASGDGIRATLKKLHAEIGTFMAKDANDKVRRKANVKATAREVWRNTIILYLEQFGLDQLTQEITDTTIEDIRKILTRAELEGQTLNEIINYIEDLGYTQYRGERIARTETTKASGVGSMVGALSTGLQTVKEWISVQDRRTRQKPKDQFDHFHMDGVTVGMDEYFFVPSKLGAAEQMLYPGDPTASAGNLVNCRCTMGFDVLRDANGIPKRIQSPPIGMAGNIYQIIQTQNTIL